MEKRVLEYQERLRHERVAKWVQNIKTYEVDYNDSMPPIPLLKSIVLYETIPESQEIKHSSYNILESPHLLALLQDDIQINELVEDLKMHDEARSSGILKNHLIPQIQVFGNFQLAEQYAKFFDFIETVGEALKIVPNWTDSRKIKWFLSECGTELSGIILANEIVPTEQANPFLSLLNNIASFFKLFETKEVEPVKKKGDEEPESTIFLKMKPKKKKLDHLKHLSPYELIAQLINAKVATPWKMPESIAATRRERILPKTPVGPGFQPGMNGNHAPPFDACKKLPSKPPRKLPIINRGMGGFMVPKKEVKKVSDWV